MALILTRQKVPTLDRKQYASAQGVSKGAYILSDPANGKPDIILIASGSEVRINCGSRPSAGKRKYPSAFVSMPCWELFEAQSQSYRDSVFPKSIALRLAVEAGVRKVGIVIWEIMEI